MFDVKEEDIEEVNRQNRLVGGEYDETCAAKTKTGIFVGEKDGKTMIVGRGLGTHSVNIRLNDRPQIVVVNLLPDGTKKE